MKPCVECGQSISDRARACPHCGRPHPRPGSVAVFGVAKWFAGLGCLGYLGSCMVSELRSRSSEPASAIFGGACLFLAGALLGLGALMDNHEERVSTRRNGAQQSAPHKPGPPSP